MKIDQLGLTILLNIMLLSMEDFLLTSGVARGGPGRAWPTQSFPWPTQPELEASYTMIKYDDVGLFFH